MKRMRAGARGAAITATALVCAVGGFVGTAGATTGAGWIGYGYANTHNGVECVQEAIDNSPAPAHVTVDGVFGPRTYSGVKSFQQWWNQTGMNPHLSVDGVVGPATGDQMLGYVGAGCYLYVPTTD
ncbi:peptidoglycan-binding protein [Streptomyces sp. NBC_00669]|uniref:peptidoglycan-binding domain-containing protein n=1 Tax=unclassified Streptomyces TaxID=2593676 RepID=UPI002E3021D7|nr:peptidoglycan-binding domain-containing protein [Streptomyces sp. NBC_00669]